METRRLDVTNWKNRPVATNRGFNPLVHIAKFIEEVLPGFEVGFFVREDLEDRRANEGYETLLKNDVFDLAAWNQQVADRFSIAPDGLDGKLKWGDNFICVRPKEWGDMRRRQIVYESQVRYNAARRGKAADIQQLMPRGLAVGSILDENTNALPPEFYNEGERPEEDMKSGSVFTNAMQEKVKASEKLMVDLGKSPTVPPIGYQRPETPVKRGRGRPKGSHNKPREASQ